MQVCTREVGAFEVGATEVASGKVCLLEPDARQSQRLLASRPCKPEVPSLAAMAHDTAADGSWRVVAQADIAVTLALLLGVPVPRNSVRKLILEQFRSHSVA